MSLILLNLQSNQQIKLDNDTPLIIGRGNVDGCSDRRVSRSHGRLTCTVDGKIHVVALHVNPCFFTRNGVPPVQQLNKNEEEILKKGDCLGLLPDAFWFQITSDVEVNDEVKTSKTGPESNNVDPQNVTLLQDVKVQNVVPSDVELVTVKKEESSGFSETTELNPQPSTSSVDPLQSPSKSELEKTRRLPLWMYEIDEVKSPSKRVLSSDEKPEVKKPKLSTDVNVNCGVDAVLDSPSTSNSQESESLNTSLDMMNTQGESSKQEKKKDGYESDVENVPDNPSKRPYCQYEGNCYRKNPQHKLDFRHPGDADYLPYDQRPFCQYGARCYRRNENHKVEFRHPPRRSSPLRSPSSSPCSRCSQASSPLPPKRRRKKVNRQNADYGDEDEYDLDDPFINDDSSDEYLPSESMSEAEEVISSQDYDS